MTKGPAPKPLERKRAAGNPGHQKLPTAVVALSPVGFDTDPPVTLKDEGRALWSSVVQYARPWLSHADLPMLAACCEAIDRRHELIQIVAQEGSILTTDKGYKYQHPALGVIATTETQITKWFGMLGLTPTDRARLGVAEVKVVSKLEELRARART